MKKLLIILTILTSNLFSSELNLILGLNVTHFNVWDENRNDYQLCEGTKNNLIGIELINGKNSYALLSFTNSYYNDSYSFNYHRIFKKGSKIEYMVGVSFIKGYHAVDTLKGIKNNESSEFINPFHIVDDYLATPTFGINYNATENAKLNFSLLGTALITSVKVEL